MATSAMHQFSTTLTDVTIRRAWNARAGTTSGWPTRRLRPGTDPRRVRLADADLPAALFGEIDAYAQARVATHALDGPPVRPLRIATARNRAARLRFAASALIRQGVPAEAVASLRSLVTAEHLRRVLLWMRQRSSMADWTMNEQHVARAFLDAARTFLATPPEALAEFESILARLRQPHRGLSDRAREWLKPFDSPRLRQRLFALPGKIYFAAERALREDRPVRAAQLHERALDLLLAQRLRPRSLAAIDIVAHLQRDRRGRFERLYLPGEFVKNGVAVALPLSRELAHQLQRHLTKFRPHLPRAAATTALFPGRDGKPRSREALAREVARVVKGALGVPFSVGLIRHIAATLLYDANPNAGPVAQRLLGHTSLTTTERMYGALSTRSAHAT
jgi:integrase